LASWSFFSFSFCNLIPGILVFERQGFLGKKDNDNERLGFLGKKDADNERLGIPNLERLLQRKTCSPESSDSWKSADSVT